MLSLLIFLLVSSICKLPWSLTDNIALAVDLTIKDGTEVVRLIGAAKQCLKPILSASGHPDLARALSLLPHLTTDQTLRQEIIVSSGVTSALIRILEWSIKSQSDNTLLVVDSICHFLQTKEGVWFVPSRGCPHLLFS